MAAVGILVWSAASIRAARGQTSPKDPNTVPLEGTVAAPDFPPGLQWMNVDRPLTMKDLRGKVVLLDFWMHSCINCVHIIPDLKKLEGKYARELVVIGVHSAKLADESSRDSIRQAVIRLGLRHPVVVDSNMTLFDQYDLRSWPTVLLIDPSGKAVGKFAGEGIYDPMNEAISRVIRTFDARGKVNRMPIKLRLEAVEGNSPLLFPGKVLVDEAGGRLFVADSGHNRVLALSLLDGNLLQVIGSGAEGFRDGGFSEALFHNPQGLAVREGVLYVADTDNYSIRRVDWKAGKVSTVAGTGRQKLGPLADGAALRTDLNSPWDLVTVGGSLYIAMAGSHQVAKLDLASGRVEVHAGSGQEGRRDGPLREATFVQPSGIASDGNRLYVADAGGSSIRQLDLDGQGKAETLVEKGPTARAEEAGKGLLYLADASNSRIKLIRPAEKTWANLLEAGRPSRQDSNSPILYEPGGVSASGDGQRLYIADTNNHAIRVFDLKTGQMRTLKIQGLSAPNAPVAPSPAQ
jgi:DNA-binding beta-propeller fold protein YncE/thiol-disulfide isomerase/thioredoxin